MSSKKFLTSLKKNAQSATELAVFGAVFIFVFGMIVNSAMGTYFQQEDSLKMFRLALQASKHFSSEKNYSRNSASIIFIEDRLSAESGKYLSTQRFPHIVSGSGTYSPHLFTAIKVNHSENLPRIDMFINGEYRSFTTAAIEGPTTLTGTPKVKVAWHPKYAGKELELMGCVPPSEHPSWCWKKIQPGDIDPKEGKNVSVDIDNDGKEERILAGKPPLRDRYGRAGTNDGKCDGNGDEDDNACDCEDEEEGRRGRAGRGRDSDCEGAGTSTLLNAFYLDFQEGDIDLTVDSANACACNGNCPGSIPEGVVCKKPQGLLSDMEIKTRVKGGTALVLDQKGNVIRTTSSRESEDTITRYVLTNHGRVPIVSRLSDTKSRSWKTTIKTASERIMRGY